MQSNTKPFSVGDIVVLLSRELRIIQKNNSKITNDDLGIKFLLISKQEFNKKGNSFLFVFVNIKTNKQNRVVVTDEELGEFYIKICDLKLS